ncbi:MAG: hypothetical protein J6W74_05070 [Bacteroidales bacterium]|nr:hypothetical protein [Bacteroidales bacterium]
MKRLILIVALLLAGISASAQSGWVTVDYTKGTLLDEASSPYNAYGLTFAKSFDIDFPSPWFLDTGFTAYWLGLDANYTYGVAAEVPLSMELRMEPFWWLALGLHAGGFAALSIGTDQLKTFRPGVLAGVNLYLAKVHLGVQYMYDFMPFDTAGNKSKCLRFSVGLNLY